MVVQRKWQKKRYLKIYFIHKAIKDALLKHYSEHIKDIKVPSEDGLEEESISFFEAEDKK